MATVLDAGYVYSSDDGEVVMAGFADQQYGTKRYVLLQRGKTVSAQERALGQDQVHMTVDDQDRSTYGGIRTAELERDIVKINLDQRCAQQLGTEEEIVIRFAATDAQRAELLARMKDLFAQKPDTLVVRLS
jgi:Immunity protein 10